MTIEEIIAKNKAHGSHFFDKDTLRFFNSTVFPDVFGNGYFITSERQDLDEPLAFKVRKSCPDGSIEADFDEPKFPTFAEAVNRAKLLAGVPAAHPRKEAKAVKPSANIFTPTLDLLQAENKSGKYGNGFDVRHNCALKNPKPNEKKIIDLFVSWADYARTYLEENRSHIGLDYVARPAFIDIGNALRTFLNYDLGRLDAGTLDGFAYNFAKLHLAPLDGEN